ncbi:ribosomal protein L3 glutamine methyltransferase [Methylomagnum ishizawai]|uniref:Ribosomal protein uL3 glutamine methyltransferase n=1 Tax=Methylomagnum ishizawai TaxID=1760988 RepID=A0A1Y6CXF6_9GAMM|nr:50S ribosomal protein L3 N(5)-glutamine methyltransferase [Methylomagnum ishizawai]SMF95359.1 ribosomal protein L3 glutamine methyltransferase [Methylomagnum ishizawai]
MNRQTTLETLSTLRDYVRYAASRFAEAGLFFGHGTAGPLDEAAALVLHALRLPYDLPGGYFEARLIPEERERVYALIQRRINERKPLAYLTHEAPFAGLSFYVDERVLVPRSPIAELIENHFAPWLEEPDAVTDILDLCTGSGCIAIACAHAFHQAAVDAADISLDALEVAQVNIARHEMEDHVRVVESDVYSGLDGKCYDIIVSNPPYVNRAEWQALPPEFHAEPKLGLESGEDGLDCVRRILKDAHRHLKPDGILVVEVGSSAEALAEAYPEVPFCWLDFERGGDGVFLLTAEQVGEYHELFR